MVHWKGGPSFSSDEVKYNDEVLYAPGIPLRLPRSLRSELRNCELFLYLHYEKNPFKRSDFCSRHPG